MSSPSLKSCSLGTGMVSLYQAIIVAQGHLPLLTIRRDSAGDQGLGMQSEYNLDRLLSISENKQTKND